jgi:uncharacterized membrane protein YgcG
MHWLYRLLLFTFLLAPLYSHAEGDAPSSYVIDHAGIIEDSAQTKLAGLLQELEQKTTAR